MEMNKRWMLVLAAACGLAILPVVAGAQETTKKSAKATASSSEAKLPEAVRKTFDDKFPNAKIEKSDEEKEGGVVVFDIEFREGKAHKETDIAEDGTMLEMTVFVTPKVVPKAVMKEIRKAAEGAKMARIEKAEITHEAKDGKVVKLDKPKTHYAVEMTKGEQTAEIVVDASGKVIDEPKWDAASPKTESSKAETKSKK